MHDKYKVSKKNDQGKWWSYGNVVKSEQYGTYRLGLKASPELKQIISSTQDGSWINFSLFEDDGNKEQKLNNSFTGKTSEDLLNDEIPF